MKIILDRRSKNREGDIVAISILKYTLANFTDKKTRDKVIQMWIEYLDRIAEEMVGANYAMRKPKQEFVFPFEEDYESK